MAAGKARIVWEGPTHTEDQLSVLVGIGRSGLRHGEAPSEELLEPRADQIYQWLSGDRLQVTRIQELLAARGCSMSYPSLRHFVIKRH